jgi:hypothetical protein
MSFHFLDVIVDGKGYSRFRVETCGAVGLELEELFEKFLVRFPHVMFWFHVVSGLRVFIFFVV